MGFARFSTPCIFVFAEGGEVMDFEFIARDVELFDPPLQSDTDVNFEQNAVPTPVGDVEPTSLVALDESSGNDPLPDDDVESVVLVHESRSVADAPAITADAFDSVLQDAHFQNSRGHFQKLPWESGIFASIFSDKASTVNNVASVCPVPPDQPQVSSPQGLSVDGPVSASAAVLRRQKVGA